MTTSEDEHRTQHYWLSCLGFFRRIFFVFGLALTLIHGDGHIALDALHVRAALAGAGLLHLLFVCCLVGAARLLVWTDWGGFWGLHVGEEEATDQCDGCNS